MGRTRVVMNVVSFPDSPADTDTKIQAHLQCRGTIPFCLHLVHLRQLSIFLYVRRVQITCGLLPTRFPTIFLLNSIIAPKREISDSIITLITYIIKKFTKNYI